MTKNILLLVILITVSCSSFAVENKPASAKACKEPVAEKLSAPAAALVISRMEKAVDPDGIARSIRSYHSKYRAELKMQRITMTMVNRFKAPDKIKVCIMISNMPTTVQAFDGKYAWTMIEGMGIRDIVGPELDFTRLSARMSNPALSLRDIFKKIEIDKKKSFINDRECFKVTCYCPEALKLPPVIIYADAESYLPLKMIMTMQTSMGRVRSVNSFADYRKLGGMMMPCTMISSVLGMTVTAKLYSYEVNIKIPDSVFAKPAAAVKSPGVDSGKPE
ncbi:hypothetical protein P0136_04925 [Lentisphaerota bacterium ZTH]|nr:hypothetical protein JYG24_03955 [Lentisphaerota bacterium]WET07333.1 hypothetical protein P0136_04925 [Lentisphaerota bacterium ZTH]